MDNKFQNLQLIKEEIDAKKARNTITAIRTVIDGRRDVGFIEVNKKVIDLLRKNKIGVIPVRMTDRYNMACIIFRDKDKAMKLYKIAQSKGGYLHDQTQEEAREIGKLLGYTDESINQYIWDKYISKIPSIDDDTRRHQDIDEGDEFFRRDPFEDFESRYKREQNQADTIFFARNFQSPYVTAKDVVILKNPRSLENVSAGVRGIIDSSGNLYIEQDVKLFHIDIVDILGKLNLIKYNNDYKPWLMPEYYITVIRLGKTNTFYLGTESGGMIPHKYRSGIYELDQIDEMPEVEEARPVYQKFLNAAHAKNPNIKFVNQVLGYTYNSIQEQITPEFKRQITKDIKKGGLEKRLLYIFDDEVKIYSVNADFIRDKDPGLNFNGFTDGGSYYVTSMPGYKKWIPENEIWIDDVFLSKPNDLSAIILHELIERHLMKYFHITYEIAHSDYAEKAESEYRQKVKSGINLKIMKEIFQKYIEEYKNKHEKTKLNESFQFNQTINLFGRMKTFLF